MQVQHFTLWLENYAKQAVLCNERRLVVLSGSESWALSLLQPIETLKASLFNENNGHSHVSVASGPCLIYGDSKAFPANIQKKSYRDKLGSESEIIIFADSQFTLDAFAALSGTLKSGGLFFLVMPDLNDKVNESLFFKRFDTLINGMSSHAIISQNHELPPTQTVKVAIEDQDQSIIPLGCITAEQYQAVQGIVKVVSGHRKRPFVLTADRGRGKSSALAIACAQLLQANESDAFKIVITAPDVQALVVFFRQLSNSLPSAQQQGHTFVNGKASLEFIAVDQLLKQPINVNLVLVDEAAAIPVYLLEQLLGNYHRMVFSSTVHGYEGAGRGFTLKFQKTLDRQCPQWNKLHINQPIRWRENDPLEQLVFDSCLLNAELPILASQLLVSSDNNVKEKANFKATAVFKVITANELVNDELLLQQVFAVLVTAHYQTKPSDLQLMLDNPQVQLTCLFSSDKEGADIVAVALLMNEGASHGVSELDITAVKNSQRRLRNQFLPQSLLSHCGFEQAFNFRYLRIMRIAVHPQVQQQGIGSYFLSKIQQLAVKQGIDFIGSSFGVNHQLLAFWLKAGFTTVRIGFTKDKASGEHSALVLSGTNVVAEQRQQQFKLDFYRCFDYLLLEEYHSLNSRLVHLLLTGNDENSLTKLSVADMASVHAYASGERLYSSCAYSLYLWLKHDLLTHDRDNSADAFSHSLVLIARLIQKHDSDTVCQLYGFTGKKMLNKHIKDYVALRLKQARYDDGN